MVNYSFKKTPELERAITESKKNGINPRYFVNNQPIYFIVLIFCRALVVINPGNPTGNCMDRKSMEEVCNKWRQVPAVLLIFFFEIVDLCYRHKLVLMADEVYQDSISQQSLSNIIFSKRHILCIMQDLLH
jgi:aspartate/methionine/tyrosine aminotransferase